MKRFITLAMAGLFFLGLPGAWAQKEVAPPPVPPMLEGQRPLAQPETKESTSPKKLEEEKATPGVKARSKTGKKAPKQARAKQTYKKPGSKGAPKKGQKATKKTPATAPATPATPAGPDEG
jgi:hypothetical protein